MIETFYGDSLLVSDLRNYESPNEEEEEDDDDTEPQTYEFEEEVNIEPSLTIKETIDAVRNCMKKLKKSIQMGDILEKYCREDLKKPLKPIIDCKTRWVSILPMLSRFCEIEAQIKKTFLDMRIPLNISTHHKIVAEKMINLLEPIQLAVEKLSKKTTNIIDADLILSDLVITIGKLDDDFSNNL